MLNFQKVSTSEDPMNYRATASDKGEAVEHVDLYRVSVAYRESYLLARVWLSNDGWEVQADETLRQRILDRIQSSPYAPSTLDDLGLVFDVPQLMATRPHLDERCSFFNTKVAALKGQEPSLKLTDL